MRLLGLLDPIGFSKKGERFLDPLHIGPDAIRRGEDPLNILGKQPPAPPPPPPVPPPDWLQNMTHSPGLMNIFNPAPQSNFNLGGLLDFNAMASQLAGQAPTINFQNPTQPINPAPIMPVKNIDLLSSNTGLTNYGPQWEALSRRGLL